MLEQILIVEDYLAAGAEAPPERIGRVYVRLQGENRNQHRFDLHGTPRDWPQEARHRLADEFGDQAAQAPLAFQDYWLRAVEPPTT